jgi:hypothetical protein
LKKSKMLAAGLVAMTFSQTAHAQVARDSWGQQQGEAQAQIAFTVPLSHSPRAEETEPRIELMLRQRAASEEFAALRRADDARWNERRIGLSLGDTPRMMLNGRAVAREERKDGISDGVWIAGGVVVALVVGAIVFYGELDEASE